MDDGQRSQRSVAISDQSITADLVTTELIAIDNPCPDVISVVSQVSFSKTAFDNNIQQYEHK